MTSQDLATRQARRQRILEERARRLAETQVAISESTDWVSMAVVGVGDERLGLRVENLKEIVPLARVTPLPGCPPWILGLATIRGQMLSVVDAARLLEIEVRGEHAFLAVVASARGAVALAVESVLGYESYLPEHLSTALSGKVRRRATLGITKSFVVVTDVEELLASPELIVT